MPASDITFIALHRVLFVSASEHAAVIKVSCIRCTFEISASIGLSAAFY